MESKFLQNPGGVMTVQDKKVLVTGGTSGIGEATARAYAAAGADVVITGRDEERGRQIVQSLAADGERARFVRADLERFEDVQRLAEEVEHVDVLVNNAAAFPFGATHDADPAAFDSTFALNVKAPFFLTGALALRMASNGGGAIVNITTTVASFGIAGMALYGSTKTANPADQSVGGGVRATRGARQRARPRTDPHPGHRADGRCA
jgi:NAD(P)-dependent dehydrogenase (short-subunit alcohol dehydrogenase family)